MQFLKDRAGYLGTLEMLTQESVEILVYQNSSMSTPIKWLGSAVMEDRAGSK